MSVIRKDLRVDIGSAAAFHTTNFVLPTGAVLLSSALNIDSAVTGSGSADRLGLLHTTGSPTTYIQTTALTQNTKASAVETTLTAADGEELYIGAMTGVDTYGGTIAGGNDDDVRVILRLRLKDEVPDV